MNAGYPEAFDPALREQTEQDVAGHAGISGIIGPCIDEQGRALGEVGGGPTPAREFVVLFPQGFRSA